MPTRAQNYLKVVFGLHVPCELGTLAAPMATTNCECPQCGSDETQRAVMGYMAGASQISGVGAGVANDGGVGVGGFGGSQQTLLSQHLAPPSKRATIKIVLITWILATIGFALYGCIKHGANPAGLALAPVIVPFMYGSFEEAEKTLFHFVVTAPAVIAIIIALVNAEWNSKEHPKLMEKYSRTWFCKRCGFAWLI